MTFPTYRTTVSERDGTTAVTFHSTDVVVFDANTITLNSGGWQTVTTKRRMNQTADHFGLGFRVWQKNFIWYVDWKGANGLMANGRTLEYRDGMKLERVLSVRPVVERTLSVG